VLNEMLKGRGHIVRQFVGLKLAAQEPRRDRQRHIAARLIYRQRVAFRLAGLKEVDRGGGVHRLFRGRIAVRDHGRCIAAACANCKVSGGYRTNVECKEGALRSSAAPRLTERSDTDKRREPEEVGAAMCSEYVQV
jgi:hypothetical protein